MEPYYSLLFGTTMVFCAGYMLLFCVVKTIEAASFPLNGILARFIRWAGATPAWLALLVSGIILLVGLVIKYPEVLGYLTLIALGVIVFWALLAIDPFPKKKGTPTDDTPKSS